MASNVEGKVQAYARKQLKAAGFIVRKIRYEGRKGAADLMAVAYVTAFIECKDEGEVPDPHQAMEHQRLANKGALVFSVDTFAAVDRAVQLIRFRNNCAREQIIKGILR